MDRSATVLLFILWSCSCSAGVIYDLETAVNRLALEDAPFRSLATPETVMTTETEPGTLAIDVLGETGFDDRKGLRGATAIYSSFGGFVEGQSVPNSGESTTFSKDSVQAAEDEPFFYIGFQEIVEAEAEQVQASLTDVDEDILSEPDDDLLQLGLRDAVEKQIKSVAELKGLALEVRSYYRQHDFTTLNLKVGNKKTSVRIGSGGSEQSKQTGSKRSEMRLQQQRERGVFMNFLYGAISLLADWQFLVGSYLLLCLIVFLSSMRRHLR